MAKMAATKRTGHKFPEILYVTRQTDQAGDTIGLAADYAVDDVDEQEDGKFVGVYTLDRVATLRVRKTLDDKS